MGGTERRLITEESSASSIPPASGSAAILRRRLSHFPQHHEAKLTNTAMPHRAEPRLFTMTTIFSNVVHCFSIKGPGKENVAITKKNKSGVNDPKVRTEEMTGLGSTTGRSSTSSTSSASGSAAIMRRSFHFPQHQETNPTKTATPHMAEPKLLTTTKISSNVVHVVPSKIPGEENAVTMT